MGDAGALLVRAGLIRPEALEVAREARSRAGGTLAEHLVLTGAVDDESLTQFFRRRLLVPRISDSKLASLPDPVVAKLPADMAAEFRAIPVGVDRDGNLTVAMSDPSDTHAVDEIGFFTEHYIVRAVASQRQIAWGLANYYAVITPLARSLFSETKGDDPATTEPYLPPLGGNKGREVVEAELEEWAEAIEAAREPDGSLAVVTVEADPPGSASGEITAVAPPADVGDYDAFSIEPSIEVDEEAVELDAEYPEIAMEGSPPELAPRAGELVVNRVKHMSVGPSTPAVVLDETLLTEPSAPAPEIEVDVEPFEEIEIDEVDTDPSVDAAIPESRQRGTESAPILLGEIVARPEPRDTEPGGPLDLPDEEEEDVVLLEVPKTRRSKRQTAVGIGPPQKRMLTSPLPRIDEEATTRLLDSLETLQRAGDRDAVVTAVVDYFAGYCGKVAFFALREKRLTPWQVRCEPPVDFAGAALSLERVSTLREIIDARLPYQGPIRDQAARALIAGVFGSVSSAGLAVPVSIRGRVVGLLYAEAIDSQLSSDNVALIVRAAGRALERVLRRKPS